MLRAERHKGMLDRVFREDHQRTLDRQAEIEKPLSDPLDHVQRLAVSDLPPGAVVARRHPDPIRRSLGPVDETLVDATGIGPERILPPYHDGTVRTLFP